MRYNDDEPTLQLMLSKKKAQGYIEKAFDVDLDGLDHDSLNGLQVTEERLNQEFVEVEPNVFAPKSLVRNHPSLFSRGSGRNPSSVYGWVDLSSTPGYDGTFEMNSTVKFGQSGSNGNKLPAETIHDYLTKAQVYRPRALILWVTSYDEIVEKVRKNQNLSYDEAVEEIGDAAIEAEEYLKNTLDRLNKNEVTSGTEFYKNPLGEIVDALGEYCGAKYLEEVEYEWREYVNENKKQYREFLDDLSEIEEQRKRSYILAATTGFGKTAMALDMVLSYSKNGTISTYNLLVSSMPRTLRNFAEQGHMFNHFYDENGNCRFKFYTINSAENYIENEDWVEGDVEGFLEAKRNDKEGVHILMASVQDFKRKMLDLDDAEENSVEVTEEDVETLINKYEPLADFEFDVLLFDEAHYATKTEKMNTALEMFDWDHRILITATPEEFVAAENPIYERKSAIFWLTRKMAYEMREKQLRQDGKGHLEDYPEYNYRLLKVREAIQNVLEEEEHPEGDAFTLSKFFCMENGELKYEQAVVEFLKAFLDIGRKHLPKSKREFSPYHDPKADLCDYSKQVGLVSVPSGDAEALCKLLAERMNKESDSNTLFLHSYDYKDDQKELDNKIKNDVLADDGNYERAIIFTHNIFLTGFDKEWIGWMLLARNIRSSKFFDQATGRCGREGPDEKTNCAVYFAGLNGFFEIMRRKHNALREYDEDCDNFADYKRDFLDLYNVAIPKYIDDGTVTWESMDHIDWKEYAESAIPKEERKLANKAINNVSLNNSDWTPGDGVTDSESDGGENPSAGPREGDETPGQNTENNKQNTEDNNDEDSDENDDEEKKAKTKNIIEDFAINARPLIGQAEFEGDSLEDFIKASEYRFGENRFTFEKWFGDIGSGNYTRKDIITLYDENIMNSRVMEEWFLDIRNNPSLDSFK